MQLAFYSNGKGKKAYSTALKYDLSKTFNFALYYFTANQTQIMGIKVLYE